MNACACQCHAATLNTLCVRDEHSLWLLMEKGTQPVWYATGPGATQIMLSWQHTREMQVPDCR